MLDEPSLGTTSCATRANNALGSSALWPPTACGDTQPSGFICSSGGILSDNPALNPHLHDYNLAFFPYGDGSAFTSHVDDPLPVKTPNRNGTRVWLRGADNMRAALTYLKTERGLSSASVVIVSGCSAGGTSAYLHVDDVCGGLPGAGKCVGLGDSGFVQNLVGENGRNYTHERFSNATQFWGSIRANAACQAVHTGDDAWMCLAPDSNYPYITTPTFILAAEYDEGLAGGDIGVKCHPVFSPSCSALDKVTWERYRNATIVSLAPALVSSIHGLFLDACAPHCQSLSNGHSETWTGVSINGVSPANAFEAWLQSGATAPGAKLVDNAPYPSNPTCVGMGST